MIGCLYLGNSSLTQFYGRHDRGKALELRQECEPNNRKTVEYSNMEPLVVLSRIPIGYLDDWH